MKRPKHVILITIDSLRYDHLSCLGYHRQTSPNIDRLAAGGALFSQAIVNGVGTPASFPSIITSTYPLMYGGYEYLSRPRLTIAEALKANGFTTAAFHSSPFLSRIYGYKRGFNLFYDSLEEQPTSHKSFLSRLAATRVGNMVGKSQRLSRFLKRNYDLLLGIETPYVRAPVLNEMVFSWLREHRAMPCFLWIHYMDVHIPYLPPLKIVEEVCHHQVRRSELIKTNELILHSTGVSTNQLRTMIDLYDAGIAYVDSLVGELVKELESSGVLEDTLMIITSDHGEEFMEHGGLTHDPKLYDELLRVPLIIYAPGLINSRERIDCQIELLDLAPTIIDALGLKKVNKFLGESLLSLIRGGRRKKAVVSEASNRPSEINIDPTVRTTSYRTEQWKYIYHASKPDELYSLVDDPGETENLVNEATEIAEDFRKSVFEHMAFEEAQQVRLVQGNIRDKIARLKTSGRV